MFRFLKFAAVYCGLVFTNGGLAHASWVAMPYGATKLPQNAMVAGKYSTGVPIYACQATYNGGLHSGWTATGKGSCSIGWGGSEVALPSFSIWQNDWVAASEGAIPGNALELGSEQTFIPGGLTEPRPRYACAGNDLNGNGTPIAGTESGKVASDLGACLFGWGNLEIHQPTYSVLVDYAFQPYQQGWYTAELSSFDVAAPVGFYLQTNLSNGAAIPYDAVLSGAEANGIPLYVCNTYFKDGYQIGKTRSDYKTCDISYGGGEYWENNYNVLVPYWTSFSGGSFPYRTPVSNGNYESETGVTSGSEHGAAFYICRGPVDSSGALYTGKVNQNIGGCSIGYNGTEHLVTNNYQVLTDRYVLAETVIR